MLKLGLGWRKLEVEFSGEMISMEIKPLMTDAFLLVVPYIEKIGQWLKGKKLEDLDENQAGVLTLEAQTLGKEIFPTHIKDQRIDGIEIDGSPMTIEQLCGEFVLSSLAFLILSSLIDISKLEKVTLGNLPVPPVAGRQEQSV